MLTDAELREAADRTIDRAINQVLADDRRLDTRQRMRLLDVMRAKLEELRQNFFDNGEGVVTFEVQVVYPYPRAAGELPQLRVSGGRTNEETL
jgi:hypothetical protein